MMTNLKDRQTSACGKFDTIEQRWLYLISPLSKYTLHDMIIVASIFFKQLFYVKKFLHSHGCKSLVVEQATILHFAFFNLAGNWTKGNNVSR